MESFFGLFASSLCSLQENAITLEYTSQRTIIKPGSL